jgi:hypothetical protein
MYSKAAAVPGAAIKKPAFFEKNAGLSKKIPDLDGL